MSNAGKRAGITGEHSSVWNHVAAAVRVLRPRLLFVENVAALLRRGLDVVHADLAAIGYDTSWLCLRASDVGAAHRRDRLFLLYLDTLAQS
ncbi:DNA cytosine methyltransferase [Micromonospora aurantiaca (nom. illeg.)]|uniref:DNA cytosine methyltransferase n=1 Tax=Micromonospora aurantiaca (nom. illeg.) TaxID=47850 RepID=UPI0033F8D5A7